MAAPLRALEVHAALLAAGASRRLGQAKQLVRLGDESLIRRAARIALAADIASLTVVLGASAAVIAPELDGLPLRVVENLRWEAGMGSSLRCAAAALSALPPAAGLLLLTCDQLEVTSEHLGRLIEAFRAGAPLVASGYAGTAGVPAVVALSYRDELAALPEAHGAKQLFARHEGELCVVPLAGGERDLDTARDLEEARAAHRSKREGGSA